MKIIFLKTIVLGMAMGVFVLGQTGCGDDPVKDAWVPGAGTNSASDTDTDTGTDTGDIPPYDLKSVF